jgi:hypothetical protein
MSVSHLVLPAALPAPELAPPPVAATAVIVLLSVALAHRKRKLRHPCQHLADHKMLVSTLGWHFDDNSDDDDYEPSPEKRKRCTGVNHCSSCAGPSASDYPQPVEHFCGSWQIETQENRELFLQAMAIPYVLRMAVQMLPPPNQTLELDDDGVLVAHTGPTFGRMQTERFEDGGTAHSSVGGVSNTCEFRWAGPVLYSTVYTHGTQARSHNARWVEHADGADRMIIVNCYVPAPGRVAVTYRRTYRRCTCAVR